MYSELDSYKAALKAYIEATYHISSPRLVELRDALLRKPGLIGQRPFLESAARYAADRSYTDLAVPADVVEFLTHLSSPAGGRRIFNPPYSHQADAIEAVVGRGQDLLVATGTGSGKTETFLLPLLAALFAEAARDRASFKRRAVRALILYPMNALVNDQLSRLRLLFGAPEVVQQFTATGGRPAKFGRYTGRTLFPGVIPAPDDPKGSNKLRQRLKPLDFYLDLLKRSRDDDRAAKLVGELRRLGKWPAKDDLASWYGSGPWFREGRLVRAVEDPLDAELLLRHEMQAAPPDLMMTNYSMLEYTLLRPIERPIWEQTREFYAGNPERRLVVVLDEAHLYRGVSGTEVAMLLRRLRQRLGLSPDRVQFICTSASFSNVEAAIDFAAELTGKRRDSFFAPPGRKIAAPISGPGDAGIAAGLAAIDLRAIHSEELADRWAAVRPLLDDRGVASVGDGVADLEKALHDALKDLPVVGRLLNLTSGARAEADAATADPGGAAQEVTRLAAALFPDVEEAVRSLATDVLVELCSMARAAPGEAPLLAARAHAFFRGLPGLWACIDPECPELPAHLRGGPTGALYAQPRQRCTERCGARVFELHTCRGCGISVAVGYSDAPRAPTFLWSEAGGGFDSGERGLPPVHLILETPAAASAATGAVLTSLAVRTGRVGSGSASSRDVYTVPRGGRSARRDPHLQGLFERCPRCDDPGTKISGHTTSGDDPFQALVSSQLLEQPPRPDSETPLRGRKVMVFSDGRQAASRLSGNLKTFSLRDATRPLLMDGYRWIRSLGVATTLDLAYAAFLIGCALRNVTPGLLGDGDRKLRAHLEPARELTRIAAPSSELVRELASMVEHDVPRDVLQGLYGVLFHQYTGLEPLGLATFTGHRAGLSGASFARLTPPPKPAQLDAEERRAALLARWVQLAVRAGAVKLGGTPGDWVDDPRRGARVKHAAKSFQTDLKEIVTLAFHRGPFEKEWMPWLRTNMAGNDETSGGMLLRAQSVVLVLEDQAEWVRCEACTRTQPRSAITDRCVGCGRDRLRPLADQRTAFEARTQYFRRLTEQAEHDPEFEPHPFIAEEHSAAIGTTMQGELFARTELYELRFQDIPVPADGDADQVPVDVLSCTTTMEVGIDIGSLTGVALRNVPPGRANYQQRAGRAGRRGASLATVITYCGADSHDQRFYGDPAGMVAGPVKDPSLKLDNAEIVRRHAFAALISAFQQERLPREDAPNSDLFMSLGELESFRTGSEEEFSYRGLERWLSENASNVQAILEELVPGQVDWPGGREALIDAVPRELLERLNEAGASAPLGVADASLAAGTDEDDRPPESEDGALDESLLLDRLFAKGVLPRYAFPTDVVAFHVFDPDQQRFERTKLIYAPQQGLATALSQYAPGRAVWVDGRRWYSMAIWSPFDERHERYKRRKLFYECSECSYSELREPGDEQQVGHADDCPACRKLGKLGPAIWWMRPPGFAHPADIDPEMPGEKQPTPTRPTRAKLSAPFTDVDPELSSADGRIRVWVSREELTLTNPGAAERDTNDNSRFGFQYCPRCGRIEPDGWPDSRFAGDGHAHPVPGQGACRGYPVRIALGTVFRTDVAVFRFLLTGGCRLEPGSDTARIVLTTLAEALGAAARARLELDPGEIAAEWRPALTPGGGTGQEVEIYLYDAVPGGAGYSALAASLAGPDLLTTALKILEECPGDGATGGCDSSCYACLRSYQNRWLHPHLDRFLGADLLRHCLTGEPPRIEQARLSGAAKAIQAWLQDEGHTVIAREDGVEVDGRVTRLVHPFFAPGEGEISLLEALRSLPTACVKASRDGTADQGAGPPPLPQVATGGVEAWEPGALASGGGALGTFDLPGARAGRKLVRVPDDALEQKGFPRGTWLVCRAPSGPTDFGEDEMPALLRRRSGQAFQATGKAWTLGFVRLRGEGGSRVEVLYSGSSRRHRPQRVSPDDIEVIAVAEERLG